jgi:uncharacterized protein YqjF (DUF2071 family)
MTAPSVRMRWDNLAFLHWRVPVDALRAVVPPAFEIDAFGGCGWIGLVPFEMRDSHFRGVPDLPSTTRFFECNVRTYVRHRGVPGVWFFSLDAATVLPVAGARILWSLPYVWSRFAVRREGDVTDYALRRRFGGRGTHVVWERGEPLPESRPGSLEHFLTERYALYSLRFGRVKIGRVEHAPWPLRRATVRTCNDELVAAAGVRVEGAPIAMCSDGVDVLGWPLEPAGERGEDAAPR